MLFDHPFRQCNRSPKLQGQLEAQIAEQEAIAAAARTSVKEANGVIKEAGVGKTNIDVKMQKKKKASACSNMIVVFSISAPKVSVVWHGRDTRGGAGGGGESCNVSDTTAVCSRLRHFYFLYFAHHFAFVLSLMPATHSTFSSLVRDVRGGGSQKELKAATKESKTLSTRSAKEEASLRAAQAKTAKAKADAKAKAIEGERKPAFFFSLSLFLSLFFFCLFSLARA